MWVTTQPPVDPSLDLCYATNGSLSSSSALLPSNSARQIRAPQARIPRPSDSFYRTVPNQILGSSDANPLVRFWNDPGPWTSHRIEPSAPAPMDPRSSTWGPHLLQPDGPLQQYRESARSEVESSVTGRQPSDSGYGRSYATKSVLSADQVDPSQECQSVTSQVGNMQMYSEQNAKEYTAGESQTSQPPSFGIQDDIHGPQAQVLQSLCCRWEGCGVTSKNQSEHRCAHVTWIKWCLH